MRRGSRRSGAHGRSTSRTRSSRSASHRTGCAHRRRRPREPSPHGRRVIRGRTRPSTMRAWRVHRYGRPSEALELDDVPEPEPGPGTVRVQSRATVLNYNEVDGCRGRYLTVNPQLPYTLGMEVFGVVDAAGAGAESWIGRRVVATAAGAFGAHAEAVIAPADMVFHAPAALDDAGAAAFFFPFHLAYLGLHERGGLQPGETVLIHAAAGGVGSAAVQLARAAGATVLATAGGPEKVEFVHGLGADIVIDY